MMMLEDFQALVAAHRGQTYAPLNRDPWGNVLHAMAYCIDRQCALEGAQMLATCMQTPASQKAGDSLFGARPRVRISGV